MYKERLAIILVVVGVIMYFLPLLLEYTPLDKAQLTGVIFAIGGVLLYYLPGSKSTKR